MTSLLYLMLALMPQRGGGPNQPNNPNSVTCVSDLRWVNNNQRFYSLASTFQVNLFSAVGIGCTPSEIRVMAIYLDGDENVICSGVVEGLAQLDQNTQSTILEFKPLVLLEFVRWRNGLRPSQPVARRLACIGPDQLTEVSRNETDRAISLRLYITLLPRNGGMSDLEIRVDPRR